jgi:deoxyribonuclease-4
MTQKKSLIGAHTSIAGGVKNALVHGKEIGATTIQIFTANQKQWATKPISDEQVEEWLATLKESEIEKIMSHASYLINLGSPKPEVQKQSIDAFIREIKRCLQLKISYLNFHPGAALNSDPQQCLDLIIHSLLRFEPFLENSHLRLLLETTAGQGSVVGYTFDQLHYIVDKTKGKIPIGVCIDTCHIFVAGYDIRTKNTLEHTLDQFDSIIGLKHLYGFHLNDSKYGLGEKKDRHAHLGEGHIGMECFKTLMQHPKTKDLPKYLETPDRTRWRDEIALLKSFNHRSNEAYA